MTNDTYKEMLNEMNKAWEDDPSIIQNKTTYQFVMDDIFGYGYKHRTLRTLFDPGSHEWTETTMDEKISILQKIIAYKHIPLGIIIQEYKKYYREEVANKEYVARDADMGVGILLEACVKKLQSQEKKETI